MTYSSYFYVSRATGKWSYDNEGLNSLRICEVWSGKLLFAYDKRVLLLFELCRPASAYDWWSGDRGFDPRRLRQQSVVEIDHEIFSKVILPHPLHQEGQLLVSGERLCTSTD